MRLQAARRTKGCPAAARFPDRLIAGRRRPPTRRTAAFSLGPTLAFAPGRKYKREGDAAPFPSLFLSRERHGQQQPAHAETQLARRSRRVLQRPSRPVRLAEREERRRRAAPVARGEDRHRPGIVPRGRGRRRDRLPHHPAARAVPSGAGRRRLRAEPQPGRKRRRPRRNGRPGGVGQRVQGIRRSTSRGRRSTTRRRTRWPRA